MMMPLNSDFFGCDDGIIATILQSYRDVFSSSCRMSRESSGLEQRNPSTSKITDFAKSLPGFTSVLGTILILQWFFGCLLRSLCIPNRLIKKIKNFQGLFKILLLHFFFLVVIS